VYRPMPERPETLDSALTALRDSESRAKYSRQSDSEASVGGNLSAYDFNSVAAVLSFVKPPLDNKDATEVQIVAATRAPLECILNFHSSEFACLPGCATTHSTQHAS